MPEESCFLDYWKVLSMVSFQWSLSLRVLGLGLQQKFTVLLVIFMWLIKSLKNL